MWYNDFRVNVTPSGIMCIVITTTLVFDGDRSFESLLNSVNSLHSKTKSVLTMQ